MTHTLYECGICGALHPWEWNGDCRSNPDRYDDEEDYSRREGVPYENIEVRSMEERVEEDMKGATNLTLIPAFAGIGFAAKTCPVLDAGAGVITREGRGRWWKSYKPPAAPGDGGIPEAMS